MNNPKSANKFTLFVLVFSIFISFVLSFALRLINMDFMKLQCYMLVVQDIFLYLIPIALYMLITKRKLGSLLPHKKLDFKNILYILAITILMQPVTALVSNISSLFVSNMTNDSIIAYIDYMPMGFAIFALAIMPAIFEEAICRGVIMSNYKTTSKATMYIITGIFFGMMHMNFWQMSYALVAGIMLAFFVHYTNSIFASMLAHFFINGYQVFFSKLALMHTDAKEIEAVANTQITVSSIIYLGIFSVVLSPLIIYLSKRFAKRNTQNAENYMNNEVGTNKKFIDIYFIAAILFFIAFSVVMEIIGKAM